MFDLLTKEIEIIESLVRFSKMIIDLLSQHVDVEEYEHMLSQITQGDDIEID